MANKQSKDVPNLMDKREQVAMMLAKLRVSEAC